MLSRETKKLEEWARGGDSLNAAEMPTESVAGDAAVEL